jgi:hypothetical protein
MIRLFSFPTIHPVLGINLKHYSKHNFFLNSRTHILHSINREISKYFLLARQANLVMPVQSLLTFFVIRVSIIPCNKLFKSLFQKLVLLSKLTQQIFIINRVCFVAFIIAGQIRIYPGAILRRHQVNNTPILYKRHVQRVVASLKCSQSQKYFI